MSSEQALQTVRALLYQAYSAVNQSCLRRDLGLRDIRWYNFISQIEAQEELKNIFDGTEVPIPSFSKSCVFSDYPDRTSGFLKPATVSVPGSSIQTNYTVWKDGRIKVKTVFDNDTINWSGVLDPSQLHDPVIFDVTWGMDTLKPEEFLGRVRSIELLNSDFEKLKKLNTKIN